MNRIKNLFSTEERKKNLQSSIAKYVHTKNSIYGAWTLRLASPSEQIASIFKNLDSLHKWIEGICRIKYYAVVYEENAGIHVIWLDSGLGPLDYMCFIPLNEIEKISFRVPFGVFLYTIIRTHNGKEHAFSTI